MEKYLAARELAARRPSPPRGGTLDWSTGPQFGTPQKKL
jgi:hypothetical protein